MIDATTGMPELPEGMAWKVSEETFNSDTTLRVSLMVKKVQEFETEVAEYWQTQPKKHWYSRPKQELVVETELETVEVWEATEYSGSLRHRITVDTESDVPADYLMSIYSWGIVAVHYDEPTPENLRKLAEKVWAEYEAAQAEKAGAARQAEVRRALVGMYPPNRLEGK